MELTDFIFFKNTPLVDFTNTIHFDSNTQRDQFFLNGGHYETINLTGERFNFIRDASTLKAKVSYDDMRGVNYCTWLSDFEPNTRYYAYVIDYNYINDDVTEIKMLVDSVMTFTQGNVLRNINANIIRNHLGKNEYNQRLHELKNNSDILKTSSKRYFTEKTLPFTGFYVVIQSSADLEKDFGDNESPKMPVASGVEVDYNSSPLDLYVVDYLQFTALMSALSDFPWITQNFRSMVAIPRDLITFDDLVPVTLPINPSISVYKMPQMMRRNIDTIETNLESLNHTMEELYNMYNLKENERHLLRNEYSTAEVYTWDGQQLFIDLGLLNESVGMEWKTLAVIGHHNEVAFHLKNYKSTQNTDYTTNGSFLNDAIYMRNFDDMPLAIDNVSLSLAKQAHTRNLEESRLISKRMDRVFTSYQDPDRDRAWFDRVNVFTSLASGFGWLSKMNSEHEYYENKKASEADLALTPSTIQMQSTDNALKRSEFFYHLNLKFTRLSNAEFDNIKKYYKLMGFELNDQRSNPRVKTHTICDYLQFNGSWNLPNIDVTLVEQMRALFERGVRFWHNNGTANPMSQNVLNNVMI